MIRLLTQSDKSIVLSYIGRNEMETSFLYSNVVEFGIDNDKNIRRCADYYGFFEDEELKGILPFYNLGSCIPHYESKEAIPLFSEMIKERQIRFLLGMDRVVRPLYEGVKDFKHLYDFGEETFFVNKNLKPFRVDNITFKNADYNNDEDVKFAVYAYNEGLSNNMNREEVLKSMKQRGAEEDFIMAVKDGTIVAQACVQTYTPKTSQIGGVFTLEEERGKGYCKAVMTEICSRIIQRGKTPMLFTDKSNISANKAYTSIGFERYDDYLLIKFNA